LLLAIAVLSLICSMCFLCVIVARLRFTSALSHTDFCIRFAAALNSKEDDVHNLKLTVAPEHQDAIIRRLETIRLPMNDALRTAAKALAMLRPLLAYMAIFRNLGIISFLVTLITSALWFSKPLAGAFAVLSLVAYAYPLIDSVRDRAMRRLDIFQRAQALLSKLHPLAVHRPSVR
jgi:hypothetical protein